MGFGVVVRVRVKSAFDQDLHRLAHELARKLEHVGGHGGREEADVDLVRVGLRLRVRVRVGVGVIGLG